MNQPPSCRTCQREDEKRQKELQAELERQARRDRAQTEHAAKVAEYDRQIRLIREQMADGKAAEENAQALEQKKQDLEAARRLAEKAAEASVSLTQETSTAAHARSMTWLKSNTSKSRHGEGQEVSPKADQNGSDEIKLACEQEWDRQKRSDGASNVAIDALMALTGLEDVKSKILNIKAKIETVLRQGTDMKDERLGIVLLGNPGTGKIRSVTINLRNY
jgi:hypothetical protein